MIQKDVIIIGNGLFGSIAATYARHRGHNVTVISDMQPLAASKASGCVLAPSWLSSLDRAQVDAGMGLLRDLYEVQDVTFQNALHVPFKAQRVDPDAVIIPPDIFSKVLKVGNGRVTIDGEPEAETELRGIVLVAAGVWSGELVEMPRMRGLYGASVRFQAQLPLPHIHVYAPYRQAVGFQLNRKEVWFGDGTALIRKTWEPEQAGRIAATVDRGKTMLGLSPGFGVKHRVTVGVRPYVEGHKAGYFDRVSSQTWVSTGGAKNGTVLAAAQAVRFIEEARL